MAAVEAEPAPSWMPADPAPLGLGAFALTTFILSGHNATFIPDLIWVGPALFYGGVAQLLAGMWEFRNRNVFGATAFSTYGGFWLSLGIVVLLASLSKTFAAGLAGANLPNAVAWFHENYANGATLVAAGGVAANTMLRRRLAGLAAGAGLDFVAPPPALCTDNGAMIAWAGLERLRLGLIDGLDAPVRPRWQLGAAISFEIERAGAA